MMLDPLAGSPLHCFGASGDLSAATVKSSATTWAAANNRLLSSDLPSSGGVGAARRGSSTRKEPPAAHAPQDSRTASQWIDWPHSLLTVADGVKLTIACVGAFHGVTTALPLSVGATATAASKPHGTRYMNAMAAVALERGEVAVVETPWRTVVRHLTGALIRKKYGA